MKTTFKTSLLYSAIILGFAASPAIAGNVLVKGKLTINGEKVTVQKAPEVSIGKAGDVVKISKYSGDSLFVYGGKLVVNGSSIEVEGSDAAVRSQKEGTATLGSESTEKLVLKGKNFGVYSSSDAVIDLDAKDINIGLIVDRPSSTVAGLMAAGGTVNVGKHAETITISALNDTNTTDNAYGVKATTTGVATIGSALTKNTTIKASHNEEVHAVSAVGNSTGAPSITVQGNQLTITSTGKNYAESVGAYHSGQVVLGNALTESISIVSESSGTKVDKIKDTDYTSAAFGIKAYSSLDKKSAITIQGNNITSSATANLEAVGAYAGTNGAVSIGSDKTENVRIEAKNKGDHANAYAVGVWVDNMADWKKDGGQMTIGGKNIAIYAESATDATAIHVASNTLTPVKRSSLVLNGDQIVIESKTTNADKKSIGIAAMSMGDVSVTGNTLVKADQALLARGDSSIEINKDGLHTTQIEGDVVFDYNGPTSSTAIDAKVDLTLSGANSYWNGNTVIAWTALTGGADASDKLDVTGMKLTVKDGAQWTPTVVNSTDGSLENGQKSVALNNLALDGGIVNVSGRDIKVHVEKMTGSGTVRLATDLKQEEGKQAGTFTVDAADKKSAVTIKLTNTDMSKELTSDEVKVEQAKKLMANVEAKDADKQILVDEGMYNGGFNITNTGATINHGPNSVMQTSLELATVAPLALNRILTNDVHKRMGDIRSMKGTSGAWVRYDGGSLSSQSGLDNDFHTIQVGVDTVPTPDTPRFGVAFSYTKSDADYKRGSADMDVYSLAAYGLWMNDNGQFVDVVARLGSAKTDMTVDGDKKGSMDNIVTALSGEFGWRFDLSKSMYVEPQVELAYTHVDADDLSLSNGSTYRFDNANSLMGRAGFALGLQCPENGNTAYLRMSAVHEFLGDSAVTGGNGTVYELDGKDTWFEYGLGANFNLNDSTYVWADVERTSGSVLDEDWRATIGVRHAF